MMLRPEIAGVVESPLVQIATLAESMAGSIKLCYGESDIPTPEFIRRAADRAMSDGHTFYTHTAGYPELREAIAAKVRALHGVTYDPDEVMATVGGTMAIFLAIRALVGSGDNAVIVAPAYAIYMNAATLCGAEPRFVPLALDARDGRFRLDVDRVIDATDRRTRLIVVNSPSNPTGWVITADEQRSLARAASERGIVILADEVYERLVFDHDDGGGGLAPSFARIMDDRRHLVVINSFSKTYNMTGWRLGWAQSAEPTIRAMWKAAEFITSNPAAMVQQAGIVALGDGEDYVRDLREQYRARRDQVVSSLAGLPGVDLPEPRGAFYAFPRIDGLTDSASFALELLRATGVALAPGSAFGSSSEGHVRLCFAAREATVARALERFAEYATRSRTGFPA